MNISFCFASWCCRNCSAGCCRGLRKNWTRICSLVQCVCVSLSLLVCVSNPVHMVNIENMKGGTSEEETVLWDFVWSDFYMCVWLGRPVIIALIIGLLLLNNPHLNSSQFTTFGVEFSGTLFVQPNPPHICVFNSFFLNVDCKASVCTSHDLSHLLCC